VRSFVNMPTPGTTIASSNTRAIPAEANVSRLAGRRLILPYLVLLVGILALSFSSLFVRWSGAPGPVVSFYRMVIAALVLLPFFLRQRATLHGLHPRWIVLALLAGLFSGLDHATWGFSLAFTNVANSTLLNNIAPLWVALVALLLFREKLRSRFWLGLALTLCGAAFVLGSDFLNGSTFGGGDLLAVASSFFYAGYFIFVQRSRIRLNTLSSLWLMVVSATVVLTAVNLLSGFPLWGYGLNALLSFLGAALLSQVTGYLALNYALGILPASTVAPTMISQPVLTAILAIPLVGEPLAWSQIMGGLTVLAGIYLINTQNKNRAM
jgi:drug/metabolite transporter (DMT)-like permease